LTIPIPDAAHPRIAFRYRDFRFSLASTDHRRARVGRDPLRLCARRVCGLRDLRQALVVRRRLHELHSRVVIRLTLVQLSTPSAMRGRVSAVNMAFINASNELGDSNRV
jgi:hypothetical protein